MLPFKRSDSVFLRLLYPCNAITRIFLRVKETSQRNTVYLTGCVVGCWDVYRSLFELEDGFPCSHTLARVSRFVGTCYAVVFCILCLDVVYLYAPYCTSVCVCCKCYLGSITTPPPYIIQPSSPFFDRQYFNQASSIQSPICTVFQSF